MVIYTIWLKRRTAWSILWGGISGGMPVLAGRVLGTGEIDWIGIALALGVLFWIPTHILTIHLLPLPQISNQCGFANLQTTASFAGLYGPFP